MTDDIISAIEEAWSHACADIPPKGLDVSRTASPAERAAAAAYLGISAVDMLKVSYRLVPTTRGRYRMLGEIRASVVQPCVVSLDPVTTSLVEPIETEFHPGLAAPDEEGDAEQSVLEAVEHEPIVHNRLETGRVIMETLLAALPAFPRAPGAELESREAGPAGGSTGGAFAALAGWKPKPE